MKVAICTTLNPGSSTLVGRILPLAHELSKKHTIHVIHLGDSTTQPPLTLHRVGVEPFSRTTHGKQRRRGLALVVALTMIAVRTAVALKRIRPDIIIISKPLPHNTLGVVLYRFFHPRIKIILDVDDFELTANHLTTLAQRAAIHWSERKSSALASQIVVATPFLSDHFTQLTGGKKQPLLIPTGLDSVLITQLASVPIPTTPTLLYLGSLSVNSGHRVDMLPKILKAVHAEYPAATLTIAGHGDDETALRAAFDQAGLNSAVRWSGRFSYQKVLSLITNARIIVDPIDSSITQRAKSSFRTLVAAAAGRPVVTSNVGIHPQLLPSELQDRFFAEPANATDYARKIIAVLQNPLTETEQNTLKKHATHYSWTELAKQYITVLAP